MKPLAIALFTLLLTSIAFAQEAAPWPPDPSAIFAPGVEVVNVEMLRSEQPAATEKPTMDTDGRAVMMPDGRVFPWPDEFPYASFYVDPGINVNDYLYIAVSRHPQGEIDTIWQLDRRSGLYSNLDSVNVNTPCGPISLDSIRTRTKWVRLPSRQFCELSTGKQTIPLPEAFIRSTDIYSQIAQPIPSPDGQMLLLVGLKPENDDTTIAYDYEFESESFTALGEFKTGQFLEFESWASDRVAVLRSYGNRSGEAYPEYNAYIVVDLEKSDMRQWSAFVSPIEPSTSIIYRAEGTPTISTHEPINADKPDRSCRITRDDILARTTLTYEVPSTCYPEYSIGDHDYYREISDDQQHATLIRVERFTGETSQPLYEGEIESIIWISTDERYAALVLDNNGIIDYPEDIRNADTNTADAQLTLVDLRNDATLYSTPAYPEFNSWFPSVRAYPDNRLEIFTLGAEENILIDLNDGDIQTFPVQGYIEGYLGNSWAAIYPYAAYEEAATQVGLYNLRTHQQIEVVTGAVYGYTTGALQPLGGDQLKVTITAENNIFEIIGQAVYTIRVPGVDIPNPMLKAIRHWRDVASEFGVTIAGLVAADAYRTFPIIRSRAGQFLVGQQRRQGDMQRRRITYVHGDVPTRRISRAGMRAFPCAG